MAQSKPTHEETWTVAHAKARLSEVIERAQSEPQTITRNGRPSVVMVSVEEWNRKTSRQGSLASFLRNSPLADSELSIERSNDGPRALEL